MEQEEKRAGGRLLRILVKYSGLMLVLVLMVVIVTVKNPNFIKIENVIGVLRQMSIYGVMGVGMAILIINGYFDLSVGAIAGLCGVLAAMVMNAGGNMVAAILTALAAGIAIGVFDGLVVCTTKIPAFVFTLAMTQVVRGAIYLITGGSPVTGLTKGYLAIGKDSWFGVPIPIYVMFAVMFLGWVLLNHTAMGRSIYATGGNPTAARYSGLKINRITLFSFGLCGAAAAVGGILLSSKLQSAQPTMGVSYEMDAISVAAIGGTSLAGGEGSIGGVLLGAMILGVINNGMVMMGINSYWQMVVKGTVIAGAVIIDIARKSSNGRKTKKA
ncbi:ABC transporter permease [Anaerotruncus sp. DFI.9.16]|uniref:ABC transporter permease n=1 Tax=Anaerotruncus sp. DFI.9.16 TaxID=2965275 RepID=UPI002109706A|nr:ABC transporter permease [Anaerotruncus sp. DFI.9.16]MCQ4896591.1 ABC transporter permease [Anaerotruncus sp. DFI.9.16]